MAEKLEPTAGSSGRNPRGTAGGVLSATAATEHSRPADEQPMEAVVEKENMHTAYRRVVSNAGSAGIDRMGVAELKDYLWEEWPRIKEELLRGKYTPQAVLRVETPKPGGKGKRKLGIPTVVDRLIQQTLLQILTPIFDPGFSASSYGFRPGRSAHQAVLKAREYIEQGSTWVRLRIAPASVQRLKGNLRQLFRVGRGWSVGRPIERLTPTLRGWLNYFRLADVKQTLEELDRWIRRRLRCVLWRQWKCPLARARNLMRQGLPEAQAWKSATNGRGPWWNAGAQHMNHAFPKRYFDSLGLLSLLDYRLAMPVHS